MKKLNLELEMFRICRRYNQVYLKLVDCVLKTVLTLRNHMWNKKLLEQSWIDAFSCIFNRSCYWYKVSNLLTEFLLSVMSFRISIYLLYFELPLTKLPNPNNAVILCSQLSDLIHRAKVTEQIQAMFDLQIVLPSKKLNSNS